ncbi:hypothetical protein J3459_013827 [Metarhizium acridum]|nr:hypothetical protein J3459_013827 [Metarhizium acridum]
MACWPSKADYAEWAESSGSQKWWTELSADEQQHGWFREVFFPPVERFETAFSSNEIPEGAAHMWEVISGEIRKHAY